VVVVEHDPDIIRAAEHLIDLGPAAGEKGGELLYSGPAKDFEKKATLLKNVDDRIIIYGPFILVLLCSSLYFLNYKYIKANFDISFG
jgi:hypothetical protein